MDATLQNLVDHAAWANQAVAALLLKTNPTDPAIHRLLSHLAHAERAWLQRLDGVANPEEIWSLLPIADLQGAFAEHAVQFRKWLGTDLGRRLRYRRMNGDECESSVGDILLHVATHSFHHRGQIATLAAKAGYVLPNLDYINYTRGRKPV